MMNALLSGAVLVGTAGFAAAQQAGDVSINKAAPGGGLVTAAGRYAATAPKLTRAFHDKKGNLLFTIDYYGEKGLPAEVRRLVKSEFYQYTILTVEEVKSPDMHVYLVDIEDDTTIKTVRVADGETEVVRDLVRADIGL